MMQNTTATLQGQDVPQTSATLPATAGTAINVSLPASSPNAQYDANGNAIKSGMTSPPATSGAALENVLTGMVADVAARQKSNSSESLATPDMNGSTQMPATQTVVIEGSSSKQSAILLWGTVICVLAAGVTLYQVAEHKHKKGHHG